MKPTQEEVTKGVLAAAFILAVMFLLTAFVAMFLRGCG